MLVYCSKKPLRNLSVVTSGKGQAAETSGAQQVAEFMDRAAIESQVEPLIRVARSHNDGKEAYARSIAVDLFEDFLRVEERFAAKKNTTEQEIIDSMRLVSFEYIDLQDSQTFICPPAIKIPAPNPGLHCPI